jgi:hypothetical protein
LEREKLSLRDTERHEVKEQDRLGTNFKASLADLINDLVSIDRHDGRLDHINDCHVLSRYGGGVGVGRKGGGSSRVVKNKSGGDAMVPTLTKGWFEEAVLAIDNDLVIDICHRSCGRDVGSNLKIRNEV